MKAVIFDCFGVLYVDSSRHFYETHIKEYERLRPELLNLNNARDYGLISQDELNTAVADLSGLSRSFIEEHTQGLHMRNQQLLEYAIQLRPNYKVGMLSNIGPGSMDQYFSLDERQTLFDACVLSGEEGITKPHPRVYEIIARRLGTAVGDCVMVDDLEANCAGADAAGMKAVLYETNQQTIDDLQKLGVKA